VEGLKDGGFFGLGGHGSSVPKDFAGWMNMR